MKCNCESGADPEFPTGGAWTHFGRAWTPTWVLFSENVCESERNGSRRVGVCRKILYVDPPM